MCLTAFILHLPDKCIHSGLCRSGRRLLLELDAGLIELYEAFPQF